MIEEPTPNVPYYTLNLHKRQPKLYPDKQEVLIFVNGMAEVDGFVVDLRNTPELRKDIVGHVLSYLNKERDNLTRAFYASILDVMSSCQSPPSKTPSANSESTSNDRVKANTSPTVG